MKVVAELIEDCGEVAAGDEFFRSRPFLDAEEVTHTLRIEGATAAGDQVALVAPLIVRDIPDCDLRDAISPYGYPGLTSALERSSSRYASETAFERARGGATGRAVPGGATRAAALDPGEIDWGGTGLVSLFIRHALGSPPLTGARPRNVVQIADPELPPKRRPSDRNQINRNRRAGYEMRIVPGPETTAAERAGFLAAYEQTMRRTGAAPRYFFGAAWFDRVLESPQAWLALAHAPSGEVAAASIAVRSDGFLHYYLSGSADSHLRDSPMKNVVAALVDFAADLALPLNLGGGISPGDRLEEFKRGFANREQPWHTSEIVCDPETYDRLSTGCKKSDFFPLYRSAGVRGQADQGRRESDEGSAQFGARPEEGD
ncbi:MAG TPA: GNAT family N-acetyltransferase [Solirubrobacterales bacterium]|nr:GNAT family N-acetyltransferase [Solirubrobacterales bacterium]